MKIIIKGEPLFVFHTFQQWVNHASHAIPRGISSKQCLFLDKEGNACLIGADFMEADKENRFPVTVYKLQRSVDEKPYRYDHTHQPGDKMKCDYRDSALKFYHDKLEPFVTISEVLPIEEDNGCYKLRFKETGKETFYAHYFHPYTKP